MSKSEKPKVDRWLIIFIGFLGLIVMFSIGSPYLLSQNQDYLRVLILELFKDIQEFESNIAKNQTETAANNSAYFRPIILNISNDINETKSDLREHAANMSAEINNLEKDVRLLILVESNKINATN